MSEPHEYGPHSSGGHEWLNRASPLCGLCGCGFTSAATPCPGRPYVVAGERLAEEHIKALAAPFVALERERCAKIAEEHAAQVAGERPEVVAALDAQECLTYTMGFGIASERIAERIRSGE